MSDILLYLTGHLLLAVPIYVIGLKTGHQYRWLAFVPLVNLWLLCDIADREPWWILVMCNPVAGILAWGYIWSGVCEMMGKPDWIGYLMIIPVVSIAVAFYIAFHEEPEPPNDPLAGKY